MNFDFPLPLILFAATLAIVLGLAVFQLMRVRRSQAKRGEQTTGLGGSE